jgi:hypothetical protein
VRSREDGVHTSCMYAFPFFEVRGADLIRVSQCISRREKQIFSPCSAYLKSEEGGTEGTDMQSACEDFGKDTDMYACVHYFRNPK